MTYSCLHLHLWFQTTIIGKIKLVNDTKNCDPKKDPKCIPPLTSDEALCKYGQSGEARGEACKRVKEGGKELPSAKPQGKSLGGAYAM